MTANYIKEHYKPGIFELDPVTRMTRRKSDPSELDMPHIPIRTYYKYNVIMTLCTYHTINIFVTNASKYNENAFLTHVLWCEVLEHLIGIQAATDSIPTSGNGFCCT